MGVANGRKSIFITGAASGIGRETAKYFVERGWFAGLYDVDQSGLDETARIIGEDNCVLAHLDVRSRDDWNAAVGSFSDATGGKMHVLFNNAGIGRHAWFEQISGEDNDAIIDINVKGVIKGVEASLPLLKQTEGARIVNTASTAGLIPGPRLAVYTASKWAVRGLTESLNIELEPLGIRVTTLMPWLIDTPILNIGASEGANVNMKQEIEEGGAEVYPVSLAAERTWEAAHGDDVYYRVGKAADRAHRAFHLMPKRMRKMMAKQLPERD